MRRESKRVGDGFVEVFRKGGKVVVFGGWWGREE